MAEGAVLAAISYSCFGGQSMWIGVVAALVALAEALGAAGVLGLKRAVISAMIDALRSWQLGRKAVRMLFDRLVGPANETPAGATSGMIAGGLQRVPLAEVERRLTGAVRSVLKTSDGPATSSAGRLRKRLEVRLLAMTAKYTLTKFRDDDAAHGGVDVAKVRAELEANVDDLIADKLRGGMNLWTLFVLLGLPVVVAAQTYLALALLRMK